MAREAYRSLYGDLTKLKDDSVLKDPAAGPDDDDELFELLLTGSTTTATGTFTLVSKRSCSTVPDATACWFPT